MCLANLQLEEKRDFQLPRELELKRLKADMAVRMRELELRARTGPVATNVLPSSTVGFNVSKIIPLVPVFHESEVETCVSAFERIAAALSWLKDTWAMSLV